MARKNTRFLQLFLILAALLAFSGEYLFRDLWFDEALTVLNFALLEPVGKIYTQYIIPNNQIVYTLILHYWLKFSPSGFDPVIWFRLLSLLFAGGTLSLLYTLFRRRVGGGAILFPVLLAAAVSVPFLIYATALRGYMASAFFVTLTLHFALEFAEKQRLRNWFWYAFSALLTVGTIPSNLAALAGVVLYAMPLTGVQFYKKSRFWLLALTPIGMFLAFYLPILPQFLGVLKLGEGWHSGSAVLQALLGSLTYSFAMLLLPASGAFFAFGRRQYNWFRSIRAGIWLLPIPMALLLPTAPFPRVFFPFWPLWILLLAGGLEEMTAWNCRLFHRWKMPVWITALSLLVLGWGWLSQFPEPRTAFSQRNGGAESDDYFYCYYLRPDHTPRKTMEELQRIYPTAAPAVYMSFKADPWPLMFYGNWNGLKTTGYLFDGPRGPVAQLPAGSAVILRKDEDLLSLQERFGHKLTPLFSNGRHNVYHAQ